MKGELQKALEQSLDGVPRHLARQVFKKKLRDAGIRPTRKLLDKLVQHTLDDGDERFTWQTGRGAEEGHLVLTITDDDLHELRSVEIQREFITAAARWMMALKL